jgi:hypothetical protein
VNEDLFDLGNLTGSTDGRFAPWDCPIDESINRIRGVYVDNFDDQNVWPRYCWLDLTKKGARLAHEIEMKCQSPSES